MIIPLNLLIKFSVHTIIYNQVHDYYAVKEMPHEKETSFEPAQDIPSSTLVSAYVWHFRPLMNLYGDRVRMYISEIIENRQIHEPDVIDDMVRDYCTRLWKEKNEHNVRT